MDLLIPYNWLKKYLDTKATPEQVAKYLSLCGPSIEKIDKASDGDSIFNIEVTTNRVDTASIQGIAREAATILPRFKIPAKLRTNVYKNKNNYKFSKKVKYLNAIVDPKLCQRFTAVLINNIKIGESPKEMKSYLEKVNVRSINNIVDISNYIMHELGQPVHTFDYDKIKDHKMILRSSKTGELVTTLDNKEFKLTNEDIVIEDGGSNIIDLCGIMGGLNSSVDNNTKNILLFVQNYNQHSIRKTSMRLGQRTEAAVLFEKGLDSENVKASILAAIELIEKNSGGVANKEILDIYPKPYKTKVVNTSKNEIEKIIGIEIPKPEITNYLLNLGFGVKWNRDNISINVPSYRANDISIKEDISEEVARIYGYHNLPCVLMDGLLPSPRINLEFKLEKRIKEILISLGAIEIYNISLVTKEMAGEDSLRLKNPLGSDTEYLRTSLRPSLISNIVSNTQEKGYIHLFELSNIYIPVKDDLPKEMLTLGGIIKNGDYRENKGIIETLLENLDIDYSEKIEEGKGYLPSQRIEILSDKAIIGEYGNLEENNNFYYEFDLQKLLNAKKIIRKYKEIAKYPPQVEDITLVVPEKTFVGEIVNLIKSSSDLVKNVTLNDIYMNSYTFNIEYQDENKTLTDNEVEKIRNKILASLNTKLGISIKQ